MLNKDPQNFLEEGNLGSKHQDDLMKRNANQHLKERRQQDHQLKCIDQTTKESLLKKNDQNKKTYQHCGKVGHVRFLSYKLAL